MFVLVIRVCAKWVKKDERELFNGCSVLVDCLYSYTQLLPTDNAAYMPTYNIDVCVICFIEFLPTLFVSIQQQQRINSSVLSLCLG